MVIVATEPAHALHAVFESNGVRVAGRSGDSASVQMSLRSWGREGALEPGEWVAPEEGDCVRCERRVQYVRDGLVEWWEDRSDGLEHGFTVASPPPGNGFLVFDVAVDGAVVGVDEGDGTAATFSRPDAPSLYYNDLAAWDDEGRTLPAWMEQTDEGLRLVVDDTDTRGAVTVDPFLTLAWTAESDQDDAQFGHSVSSAGDVNGDGYGDVVVGAPTYSSDLYDEAEGWAFLYLGSASGLATTAAWTATLEGSTAWFGWSVASAGDVNGDGYGDVVVSAVAGLMGSAYLYLGSASGPATIAAWTADSDQYNSLFGHSVSSAGDVNGWG